MFVGWFLHSWNCSYDYWKRILWWKYKNMLDSLTAAALLMLYFMVFNIEYITISINIKNCIQEFKLKINLNTVSSFNVLADNIILKSNSSLISTAFLCCEVLPACMHLMHLLQYVQLPRKVHDALRYHHTAQKSNSSTLYVHVHVHPFLDFSLSTSLKTYHNLD